MQISTVGKNIHFGFFKFCQFYKHLRAKVTEPTHQHAVRVESRPSQHILMDCLPNNTQVKETESAKLFFALRGIISEQHLHKQFTAPALVSSADISLCPAQLEGQHCKSNFLHHLQSAASQLSGAQTKSLETISIIHAAGKQADLFHDKLPHREILNRAD